LFSFVGVLTTLRQVQNLNKIIDVAENWLDDPCANCKRNLELKQCLKIKEFLEEENYNLIEEHKFFEELQVDGD
jgi:hypothetical protein